MLIFAERFVPDGETTCVGFRSIVTNKTPLFITHGNASSVWRFLVFDHRVVSQGVDDLPFAREGDHTRERNNALSHEHHSRRLQIGSCPRSCPLLVAAPGPSETIPRRFSFMGRSGASHSDVAGQVEGANCQEHVVSECGIRTYVENICLPRY